MADLVDGSPTKRLVTYVLTKDVRLEDAILDLVDNSIDGARRSGKKSMAGYEVRVTVNRDYFKIEDNCGGIPYKIAKDYAFRFGRPEAYAPLDGPPDVIGNFGVGMKRALFKMGQDIKVTSKTQDMSYEINIDVEKWLADDKNWHFEFSNVKKTKLPSSQTGTSIEVRRLYPGVAEQFGLRQFLANLKTLAREKEAHSLLNGLAISINDDTLVGSDMKLLGSREIIPFHKSDELEFDNGTVNVEIYAGLDEPDNDNAGWYVICNGRTILNADRSPMTGWGNKTDSERVPSYHHQYARFRGYLIFHSETPNLLPWNTTKTGVDAEHPLYRRYLQEMISAMRQVFSFLNALDRESDMAEQPLTETLALLKPMPLKKIKASTSFSFPVPSAAPSSKEKLRWIRYQKPVLQVQQVMDSLEVDRPEEAGSRTFDLYFSLNIEQ